MDDKSIQSGQFTKPPSEAEIDRIRRALLGLPPAQAKPRPKKVIKKRGPRPDVRRVEAAAKKKARAKSRTARQARKKNRR